MVAELENTYIKTKKCPECNSDLKLRFGKNGDFLGCSSYPKCKHTEQIK
jgi:DNA topoisomerase-1